MPQLISCTSSQKDCALPFLKTYQHGKFHCETHISARVAYNILKFKRTTKKEKMHTEGNRDLMQATKFGESPPKNLIFKIKCQLNSSSM